MAQPAPSPHAFAIACNADGTYLDVTDTVVLDEGEITYEWGQTSPFGDIRPGRFAFTLDNRDGRYTPDNPASTLGRTLVEGMGVSWQMNTRIVSGSIRTLDLIFPAEGLADAAKVRVICDDIIADMARAGADGRGLRCALIDKAAMFHWPLNGPASTTSIAQTAVAAGSAPPMLIGGSAAAIRFGVSGSGQYSFDTGAELNGNTETGAPRCYLYTSGLVMSPQVAPQLSVTFRPTREVSNTPRVLSVDTTIGLVEYRMGRPSTGVPDRLWVNGVSSDMSASMQLNVTYRITIQLVDFTNVVGVTLAGGPVDGTASYATAVPNTAFTAIRVCQDDCPGVVERIYVGEAIEADFGDAAFDIGLRLANIADLAGVTWDLETGFSSRAAGSQNDDSPYLTSLQNAMRVEGGRIWATDTGTLLSPAPVLKLRPLSTSRPATASYALSVTDDIHVAPKWLRDITGLVSSVRAESETTSLNVTDSTVAAAINDKSVTLTAPAYLASDLRNLAEDRIRRGAITTMRVTEVTVDAQGTTDDRWADLLGTEPGDRVTISAQPTAQIGPASWDGWVIGGNESHTQVTNRFTYYYEPAYTAPVFDTDRFAAAGVLSLSGAINSSVTSISVATTGEKLTTTVGDFPLNIMIDREIMTVSAPSAATPQVLTVARAQAGTLAAAHSVSATVEIAPYPVFDL